MVDTKVLVRSPEMLSSSGNPVEIAVSSLEVEELGSLARPRNPKLHRQ